MPTHAIAALDFVAGAPDLAVGRARGGQPSAKYLPRSNAWQHLYERYYLFDADRVPDVRKSSIYMGHCRFGIHKYHAEALIKIRAHMPPFYISTTRYLRGFFRPHQTEAIARLLRGVRASMAARDTVLVDTNVTRTIQLRDVIVPDGSHYVGQQIEN
jgi:hypothetical protein